MSLALRLADPAAFEEMYGVQSHPHLSQADWEAATGVQGGSLVPPPGSAVQLSMPGGPNMFWGSIPGIIGGIGRIAGGIAGGIGGLLGGIRGGGSRPVPQPPPGLPGIPTGPGGGGGINTGGVLRLPPGVAGPIVRGGARAAGKALGKIKNTKWGKVIAGVGGYWILDAAAGWIWQEGKAPSAAPRMNVMNPRALARADRRICGFSSRARPILRSLGYQVSSTRQAKSCGPRKRKCR